MRELIQVNQPIELNSHDSGIHQSIVRLNNQYIDSKRKNKDKFFRREPVIVTNTENGNSVLRYVMGQSNYLGMTKRAIGLDYDAIDALGSGFHQEVKFSVRKATILEVYQWLSKHPDLSIQLSIKLGLVGAFLGILGFIVGMAGLMPIILQ